MVYVLSSHEGADDEPDAPFDEAGSDFLDLDAKFPGGTDNC